MNYNFGLLTFLALFSISFGAETVSCPSSNIKLDIAKWEKNMLIDERLQKNGTIRPCTEAISAQIIKEVSASLFYLKLGAHYSEDQVNRPGFAKFFLDAAKEEREHAAHLIDYLTMRGETDFTFDFDDVIKVTSNDKDRLAKIQSGRDALKEALKKELDVTESIKGVIKTCEKDLPEINDYHIVDYLTGVYLEEQYKGQRDLAGKIATLTKFVERNQQLGEFMFDKTLL